MVQVQSGDPYCIDARSGQIFTITPERAEQIALNDFGSQAQVRQIERITRHDFVYLWGPLPAYRLAFDDDRATISHVSIRDGTVRRTDRWRRIKMVVGALHTFEPLNLIIEQETIVRRSLLIMLSIVGIMAVGTGYYLALPRRRVLNSTRTSVARSVR
jgi:hypothetical protein